MTTVESLLIMIFIVPVILIAIGIYRSRKYHTVSYMLLVGLLLAIPMLVFFLWQMLISS